MQTLEVAGADYVVLPVMQGEALARAILVRKLGGALIVWTVDANADTALATAQLFINSIKSTK